MLFTEGGLNVKLRVTQKFKRSCIACLKLAVKGQMGDGLRTGLASYEYFHPKRIMVTRLKLTHVCWRYQMKDIVSWKRHRWFISIVYLGHLLPFLISNLWLSSAVFHWQATIMGPVSISLNNCCLFNTSKFLLLKFVTKAGFLVVVVFCTWHLCQYIQNNRIIRTQ